MKMMKYIIMTILSGSLPFFPLNCQVPKPGTSQGAASAAPKVMAPAPVTAAPVVQATNAQPSAPTVPAPAAAAPLPPAVQTPVAQPAPAAPAPAVNAQSPFQTKLAEMNNRPALVDKITGIKELLSLITNASSQADKDSFISACNDLFANQGTMKKDELMALKDLFEAISSNKFLLAAAQRTAMEQLFASIKSVLDLADDNQPLIAAVKSKMEQDKQDYSLALKAVSGAINLFNSKLSPDEHNRNSPTSLVALLRAKIPSLYNNRAGKKLQDLQLLNTILSLGQSKKDIAEVIGKSWSDTVALDVELASAKAETNILSQLTLLQNMNKKINAQTDRYERGQFVDLVTTIFNHRFERAAKEIDALKNLINTLSSGDFVKNRVFDAAVAKNFETWKKILDTTSTLLALDTVKSIDQKIAGLIKVLPNVTVPAADYERMLFTTLFLNVFIKRSEIVDTKPDEIETFLLAIKNTTPALLNRSQIAMLTQWLDQVRTKVPVNSKPAAAKPQGP